MWIVGIISVGLCGVNALDIYSKINNKAFEQFFGSSVIVNESSIIPFNAITFMLTHSNTFDIYHVEAKLLMFTPEKQNRIQLSILQDTYVRSEDTLFEWVADLINSMDIRINVICVKQNGYELTHKDCIWA